MEESKPIYFSFGAKAKVIDKSYVFLSNFYESPFTVGGHTYRTVEHYFQSQKTEDEESKFIIINALTPGSAKGLGRKLQIDRELWQQIRVNVMRNAIFLKFSLNPDLKEKLIATGTRDLREFSPRDKFWGGSCKNSQNTLGKIIMSVREELKNHKDNQ
ncbi:hypothetical protein SteCoe_32327 [Stentor coeruleus]|uniref:NADAR domain-containing protein n=1 Tax=Stentor coeruleus TaxID=5963 RepID=A0A1R2AZ85_9CILI|nr:hypothetical protein SteCoe_32327 [Stentor coeruleus]